MSRIKEGKRGYMSRVGLNKVTTYVSRIKAYMRRIKEGKRVHD